MKVFISVPMKGYTDEEIEKNINRMIEIGKAALKDKGELEFVDNFHKPVVATVEEPKHLPVWYLSKAIETISNCDAILIPIDTYGYPGCECEADVARRYYIPIYTIPNNFLNIKTPLYENVPCCDTIPEDDE